MDNRRQQEDDQEWYPQRTASVSQTHPPPYQRPPPPQHHVQHPHAHPTPSRPGYPPPPQPYYQHPQPQGHNALPLRPYPGQYPPPLYYRQPLQFVMHQQPRPIPVSHGPPPPVQQQYIPGASPVQSHRASMMPPPAHQNGHPYLLPPQSLQPPNRGPSPGFPSGGPGSHRQSMMVHPSMYDGEPVSPPGDIYAKRDSIISNASSMSSGTHPSSNPDHHQHRPNPEFVPLAHFQQVQSQLFQLQRRMADGGESTYSGDRDSQDQQSRNAVDTVAMEQKISLLQEELNTAITEITRLSQENEAISEAARAAGASETSGTITNRSESRTSKHHADEIAEDMQRMQTELSAARSVAADVIRLRARNAQLEAELTQAREKAQSDVPTTADGQIAEIDRLLWQARLASIAIPPQPSPILTVFRDVDSPADLESATAEIHRLLTLKAQYESYAVEADKVYQTMHAIIEDDQRRISRLETHLQNMQQPGAPTNYDTLPPDNASVPL
ncbi:hypothetical protein DFJ77DRAFT_445190 [Powellomyces hirtus]|nr:hypothetical protein DFJ77DRAFT_445190 [Powellomyces hirtus]